MRRLKRIVLCLVVCALTFSFIACGKEDKSNENQEIYGKTISGLEDDQLFAIIEINLPFPVLLVSSQFYDDGHGNQAALSCDVYYRIDGEVKNIGTLESLGTAYPVSYDQTGIYTASGHEIQRYGVDVKNGSIELEEGVYEIFDKNATPVYSKEAGGHTEVITEKEYFTVVEKYGRAEVVNFSYGAS